MRGFLFVLKIFLLCAPTLFGTSAAGQSGPDLALKNIQRQKWERAFELLTKTLAKDSLNVTAKYVLAQYFFSDENPAYCLDSAYHHVLGALHDFQSTTLKQRERLRRFPIDTAILTGLRSKIDSTAFMQAETIQTEVAWIYFIENFPYASSIPRAMALRDSVAFADAAAENTYQSYQNFSLKYPLAKDFARAKRKYDELLFAAETADQTLKSFETFLEKYPNTPYRARVEQTIFEYQTAPGEHQNFIDFIRAYPQNLFVKRAKNILFHLIPERDRAQKWPSDFSDDSLTTVIQSEQRYLVPFLRNKKFGFMDAQGMEIIPALADSLDPIYPCGNIDEDIIALPDKVISKNGAVIWNGTVTNIEDLGFGFLILDENDCRHVIHKTGFNIGKPCIDNAKILNGKFIAIEKDKRWSVWTLSGRSLMQDLQEVFSIKNVIVSKQNNSTTLQTAATLASLPSSPEHGGISEYDQVRSWNDELIVVKKGSETGLIDQALNTFIGLRRQTLNPAFFGVIATDSAGTNIYNYAGGKSKTFRNIIVQAPWLAVKDSLWRLFDVKSMKYFPTTYDTIFFSGPFAIGNKKDSCRIFFSHDNFWSGLKPANVEFILGMDSSRFMIVQHGERKTIFNQRGQKLFSTTLDKIQYAGSNHFIVHKKDKKGLMTHTGKMLLPVEYDAIGTVSNGVISLLKSVKFGLFDCIGKKKIPPSYAKNLLPYNSKLIVGYKDGLYGFIGWDNKAVSKFEFNDIQFWNDTVALVKRNSQWALYEMKTKKVVLDQIKDYDFIRNTSSDKLAIIYQGTYYGVIHNLKGTIIPITFSDVINVGSAEKPLYFAEKNVPEAAIFVVVYYDDEGVLVRKEIYDQEDYDKIYCHEN